MDGMWGWTSCGFAFAPLIEGGGSGGPDKNVYSCDCAVDDVATAIFGVDSDIGSGCNTVPYKLS